VGSTVLGMRKFEIPQSLMHSRPKDALNLKHFAKKRSQQLAPVDVFDSSYLQQLRVVNMMTNTSSNRNKAHLGLGALLLGLAFISWLVLLGGLAGVQKLGKQC